MSTIQKTQIIKQIAEETDYNNTQVTEIINTLFTKIAQNLKENDKIQFTGFGSFNAKDKPARKGRNPRTGEEIEISARRQTTFSAGSELKEEVNS